MGSPSVPYPHDVVIDSNGYVFADSEEQKAVFALSPIFVTRQNTQGDYGDNQQDFWLTWTQKDWSKGEQQRYESRPNDENGQSRYWRGDRLEVRTPGEVTMGPERTSLTFAAATKSGTGAGNSLVYVSTSTTLYHVAYDGTITSDGVHGLGASPSRFGMCWDGNNVFMSTGSAGTVGIRRWSGAAFSTFSATSADSVAFLNNTLYGYNEATAQLNRYDTAGAATALFNWKDAIGSGILATTTKLLAFGGKLLILRYRVGGSRAAELWMYDGTSTSKLTEFPSNFVAYDMEILNGAVFVSGAFEKRHSTSFYQKPAIYFYKDGQQDLLWKHNLYLSLANGGTVSCPPLTVHDGCLVWGNAQTTTLYRHDPVNGGVSSIFDWINRDNDLLLAANNFFVAIGTGVSGLATGNLYPISTDVATSATTTLFSSLIDFDTSLRKAFLGVRVEFDSATDGDGGSVDIAYRYDNVDVSTYTSLQTGATTGVEYKLPTVVEGTTHQSMSVKVTLNKGTSADGPKLKRVQVRAIPVQPAFKRRQYVLLLGGRNGESPVQLRDGSYTASDGKDMATALQTSAGRTAPFAITDHLGVYTGVIEDLKMTEYKPEQWIAAVTCREV